MAQSTPTLHSPPPAPESAADQSTGGRRYRFVLASLLLAAVVIWFGPAIVTRSGLRHKFVHAVLPEYPGGAAVGAASLGWFSPVVLRDVSLSDADEAELISIEELTTSRSLASLLFAPGNDFGTITLRKPRVTIRLRTNGSNLEDVIRPVLEAKGSGSGMTLLIEDGHVEWTSISGAPSPGGLEQVTATVRQAAGASWPERIDVDARLSDGERSGTLSIRFAPAGQGESTTASEAAVKAQDLPLAPLQPWFDRFQVGVQPAGMVSADILATAPEPGRTAWSVDGSIEGRQLRLTVGEWRSHPVLLETLTLKAKGSADLERVTIENATISSDVGSAKIAGESSLASLPAGASWSDWIGATIEQNVEMTASVDLARLAKQLPPSVGLHQAVESGRVDLEFRSGEDGGDRIGFCKVRASDIVAGQPARRVVWQEPFSLDVRVRRDARGVSVDRLEAKADFLTVTGSGSTTDAKLAFDADLDKLRQRMAQFVTLPEGTLAGRISGSLSAKRVGEAGETQIDASGRIRDFSFVAAGRRWAEQELEAGLRFEATTSGTGIEEIHSGRLTIRSVEQDELTVTLLKAVSLDEPREWPLSVVAKGEIARWLSRLRIWNDFATAPDLDARGSLNATADVRYGESEIAIQNLVADATNLHVRTGGVTIDEPRVRLTGSGGWSVATNVLSVPQGRLICETATVDATKLELPLSGDRPAAGHLAFRAGIGRVAQYVLPEIPTFWLSGVAAGSVDLRHEKAATMIDARIDLEHPRLSRSAADASGRMAWEPIWTDDRASVSLAGRFDHASDVLAVSSCRASGSGLSIEAAGRIERPTTEATVDISGKLSFDLESLRSRFAVGLPDGVAASGKGTKPFHIRGPLLTIGGISPQLSARAGIGWESADLWGLSIGAGELTAGLSNRTLTLEPFDWPVGGGRVHGSAAVLLNDRAILTVAKGRLAENIVLTPDICRQWLKYAAPTLADSTAVEGSASFDVRACSFPLARPESAEAEGVLELQNAKATPGPFAKSVLDVVRQIQAIAGQSPTSGSDLRLVASKQNVTVRVSRGRVFHDRFTMHIGDEKGPAIATTGSVGFDETLDLVAEVPLDREWFKEERIATALGGQTLRIPIRGTLSRPAPDPRALRDFARKAAAGAVGGFLDRELEQQVGEPLRKLFD
ncbi:MAG: hypothetical protein WBC44_12165 [Planctomycetaceae bacterium]